MLSNFWFQHVLVFKLYVYCCSCGSNGWNKLWFDSIKIWEFFWKKKLREDKDGGLILLKLKVLFVNFLQPVLLDCGLILRKAEGFFAKFSKRGTWTAGWFLLSSRAFLQNGRGKHDLSRPPGWSDGRDLPATWPASLASELARIRR